MFLVLFDAMQDNVIESGSDAYEPEKDSFFHYETREIRIGDDRCAAIALEYRRIFSEYLSWVKSRYLFAFDTDVHRPTQYYIPAVIRYTHFLHNDRMHRKTLYMSARKQRRDDVLSSVRIEDIQIRKKFVHRRTLHRKKIRNKIHGEIHPYTKYMWLLYE